MLNTSANDSATTGQSLLFGSIVAGVAGLGTKWTTRALKTAWYRDLKKPSFQPPPALFGPVWTGLYKLIESSGKRVYIKKDAPGRELALGLWGTQLALNGAWSYLFFEKKNPKAALVDLGLTLAATGAYTVVAHRVDRKAAWMMAPYLAWLTFAGVINAAIVLENPDAGESATS